MPSNSPKNQIAEPKAFSKPIPVFTRDAVDSLDPIRRSIALIMEKTGEIIIVDKGRAI